MRNTTSASRLNAALTHLRNNGRGGSASISVTYCIVNFNFAGFVSLGPAVCERLEGSLLTFIFFIGIDNSLHKRMPHYIFCIKMSKGNAAHLFKNLFSLDQAAFLMFC